MSSFKLFCTLLIVILAITTSWDAAFATEFFESTYSEHDSNRLSFKCNLPQFGVTQVSMQSRVFQKIDVESDGFVGESGGPALPSWSRWVEIPAGMRPVMNYSVGNVSVIPDLDIAPFPSLGTVNPNVPDGEDYSRKQYSIDRFYPSTPASISGVVTIGTKRLVLLDVMPYSYNPAARQLRIHEELSVEIDFIPDPVAQFHPDKRQAPVYGEIDRAIGLGIPRRDDLGIRADFLGHYVVVVADDQVAEVMEPLIQWKKRKGYLVTLANLDDIGGQPVELAQWLQAAWDEWEVPPNFVLLAGDASGQTVIRYFDDNAQEGASWHASDQQYVTWEGEAEIDEWIPEGLVGRLPASNLNNLGQIVEKILGYERNPYMDQPWVEGGVLIANGVQSCISTNVAVRELMQGVGYDRDNIYEAYSDWHQGQRPDHNIINSGVNNGVGFLNFRGYNNWGDFYSNNIHNLRNEWKLPVVTGMVCATNDFTNTFLDAIPECRGESWVRGWNNNAPHGGIACFGPTDLYTHTWFNNVLDAEFYHAILNNDVQSLGAACLASKLGLLRNYPSSRRMGNGLGSGYYLYTYNLLGDPGMQVWSKNPRLVFADFAAERPAGSTLLNAVVIDEFDNEIPGAYIHIFRQTEDGEVRYGGFTDQSGRVSLAVEPLEPGEYQLTVTGPNLLPVLESFEVTEQPVYTSLTGVSIDGDYAIPGSNLSLTLTLTNTGAESAEAFRATLRSTSPWVNIIRAGADYPALDPGEESAGDEPFVIEIAPGTPNGTDLGFQLIVVYNGQEWREAFNLNVTGYDFRVVSFSLNEEELVPGADCELTVTVENTGEIDTEPVRAFLTCDNPRIQIREAESFIGEIARGEQASNQRYPFVVYAAPDAYAGSEIEFDLLISDDNGVRDSLQFAFTLGGNAEVSPQGPTVYGYWAFDSRDTTAGLNPEYEWIEGDENLRMTDNDDGGNMNWSGPSGERRVIDLPFDFVYYGQRYTQITISTNGWIAFGRSDQVSWNNQEIGSPLGPAAMLCPYWTDLWSGRVFTTIDDDNDRFAIVWDSFRGGNETYTYAVHLYDPRTYVTATGDGEIVFMYNEMGRHVNIPRQYPQEAVTIGFCSPDRRDGMTITHAGVWDPRTDNIGSRMAIKITTGPFLELGGVFGRITSVEDDLPMESVRVMLDGTGFYGLTDADGNYRIEGAPIGTYSVTAQLRYFNNATEADVEIREDEMVEIDLQMTYPTFDVNIDEIRTAVESGDSTQSGFEVSNAGNGRLDYILELNYEAEEDEERDNNQRDGEWDVLFDWGVGDTVNDPGLYGMAYDGEYFYLSGQVERQQHPHKIYVLDKDGRLTREFDQYTVDSSASRGYFELDFNGENLLAVEGSKVLEITRDGEFVRETQAPDDPTQAVAWSPDRESIFTKYMVGRIIYEIDVDGNIINEFSTGEETLYVLGMSWFPADDQGFYLYIFSHNRYPEDIGGSRLMLSKLNPETGEIQTVAFLGFEGMELGADRPQGCDITKKWNPLVWTFVALVSKAPMDRLIGYEIGPNLTWISYDPESGSIPPGESQSFTVDFYSVDMPDREYYVVLEVYHNAVGDMFEIPTYFQVGEVSIPDFEVTAPSSFEFVSAYPNPFNPLTSLEFSVPVSEKVSLYITDISGRVVEEVDLGRLGAGIHTHQFDASHLSSGVYIAKIKSARGSAAIKLVLMK